jgi:hypothetical protein
MLCVGRNQKGTGIALLAMARKREKRSWMIFGEKRTKIKVDYNRIEIFMQFELMGSPMMMMIMRMI